MSTSFGGGNWLFEFLCKWNHSSNLSSYSYILESSGYKILIMKNMTKSYLLSSLLFSFVKVFIMRDLLVVVWTLLLITSVYVLMIDSWLKCLSIMRILSYLFCPTYFLNYIFTLVNYFGKMFYKLRFLIFLNSLEALSFPEYHFWLYSQWGK